MLYLNLRLAAAQQEVGNADRRSHCHLI